MYALPGLVSRVVDDSTPATTFLSSTSVRDSEPVGLSYGTRWPYASGQPGTRRSRRSIAEAYIDPGGLFDVHLDLGWGVSADFGHSVYLTSSALATHQPSPRQRMYGWMVANLFVPVHFGLEGHAGVEREDETDGVCLALQALEHGAEE